MKFSASTVYSYKRLLGFSDYTCLKKKWIWIIMAAATVIVSICFSLQFTLLGYDSTLTFSFCAVILIDLLYSFMCFGLPRITLKKSPALNAQIRFEFYESFYKIEASLSNGNEQSQLNYSALKKVDKTKNSIYLYVSQNQAYIVDKDGFTLGSAEEFMSFISSKIESQNYLNKRKNK